MSLAKTLINSKTIFLMSDYSISHHAFTAKIIKILEQYAGE